MPKPSGEKTSLFNRIFGHRSHKDHRDGSERNRNNAEVTFANDTRYYEHQGRLNQTFGVDQSAIRDENGRLKATAAYHTGKSSKPSRGARSCITQNGRYTNDSSDSDTQPGNSSFRSNFTGTETSKRYSRRSSKRHKKVQHAFDEYDEQSSSNSSYHPLKPLDMNAHPGGRLVQSSLPDYAHHSNRQVEEARIIILEQKFLESNQKIKEYVNKYRREKARANELQNQLNEMSKRSIMESQMVYELNKQIQKLQEENDRLRNPYMPPSFNTANTFRSQFGMTPNNFFPNYPTTPNMDFNNTATRTVSEADNDSALQIKNFRSGDGVPEQLLSESSFQASMNDEPEIPRATKNDSLSICNSLINDNTIILSDKTPSLLTRDDGYSTSENANQMARNINRRSRHFGNTVPKKIRRTSSWN